MMKKLTVGLGTLFAALAGTTVLAASGGAAKPADTIVCRVTGPATTTVTWTPGTTEIDVTWKDGTFGSGSVVGNATVVPPSHGPGSAQTVGGTPPTAASAQATFVGRQPAKSPFVNCT